MSRISWTVPGSSAPVSTVASPAGVGGVPGAFAMTAGGFAVAGPWAAIYRVAYERALAATAPSPFQKRLEPCWN